jgi:hypothetical protein
LNVAVATVLAKAWERASDRAVEEAARVVARLVARLRRRFMDKGDEASSSALALLKQAPDSARARDGLAVAVDRQVASDAAFDDELAGLIEEAGQAGLVAGAGDPDGVGPPGIGQVQNTQGSHISIRPDRPWRA